jgi:ornithine cyclodeaminase/alanine dehydrogenase-like protein (mu-crystallin family)
LAAGQRRVKVPLAQGSKYVGLVFVFSVASGELLAIFPDGFHAGDPRRCYQRALGAIFGAEKLFGDGALRLGWQARPALLAMCKVLPIEEVRVYSPSRENRDRFVD